MKRMRFTRTEWGILISLWLMLTLPCIYRFALNGEGSVWYILVCLAAGILPTLLLYSIRRRLPFALLTLILMFASGVEAFIIVVYKDFMRSGNLMSMLTTTSHESSNFAANNQNNLLYCLPIILLAIFAIDRKIHIGKRRAPVPLWTWVVSLLFVLISWASGHIANPPYNLLTQGGITVNQLLHKQFMLPVGDDMQFEAKRDTVSDREIYIFGVGESMRYDHTSISGYHRQTTPLLEAEKNLVPFSNYHSTATLTYYSVPQMISRATASDFNRHYTEKSIIEPYKECGFKTFVISTHKLLANYPYLTRGADGILNVAADSIIPVKIDSLSRIYPKVFFVIQMMQCHSYYSNFDAECDLWHPNLVSDPEVKSDSLYLNAYDCTIRYTDKMLTRIMHTIDKPGTRSALIFASDHGEVLTMHGHRRGNSLTPKEVEYHVPMYFWYNDRWAEHHTQQVNKVKGNKDKATNADNLFYSACDMADIRLPKQFDEPQLSILSAQFKSHKRELLLPDGRSILNTDK